MVNKKLLIFTTLFLMAINVSKTYADDTLNFSTRHGIGIAIGGPAIAGITYRKFFQNRLGFQTSFLTHPYSSSLDMLYGIHLFYTFNNNHKNFIFYGIIGTSAILESFKKISMAPGVGLGSEFYLNKNISLSTELALAPLIHINHRQHILGFIPLPFFGFVLTYYIG